MSSFASARRAQAHSRAASYASDDWAPGAVVNNFDGDLDDGTAAAATEQGSSNSRRSSRNSNSRPQAPSTSNELPDWEQWGDFQALSGSNSKAATPSGQQATNQADDDFFAALERSMEGHSASNGRSAPDFPYSMQPSSSAATAPAPLASSSQRSRSSSTAREPSPPMIDLRDEQRRIRERDRSLQAGGITGQTKDDDWFAAFEKRVRSGSRGTQDTSQSQELRADQMDSMLEASTSPLPPPTPAEEKGRGASGGDYFGGAPNRPAPASRNASQVAANLQQGSPSWWGSIRGLGSGFANRAAEYLDPGVDFGDEELKIARAMGAIDLNSREVTPAVTPNARSRSGTPAPGSKPTPAVSTSNGPPKRKNSAPIPATKLVSGAPGVDFSNLHPHWNTGSWTLPESEFPSAPSSSRLQAARRAPSPAGTSSRPRRKHLSPLPVSLLGRTEDTSPVITSFHSSHIQPYLPPRLKLGRTWRLLYSSDQHGVNLETLYDKVRKGLDPRSQQHSDGGSLESRQDSWLRGASSATRAALGASMPDDRSELNGGIPSRLGSGLTSMSDAGLVLAVRDDDDNVFGAFVNEAISRHHRGYYGNGECFLFRQVLAPGASDPETFTEPYVQVYPSTSRNTFFALSESGYLAFGGSSASYQAAVKERKQKTGSSSTTSTSYGLWLDESFSKGVTGRCETFENVPLCDPCERKRDINMAKSGGSAGAEKAGEGDASDEDEGEGSFEPVFVEVWAVGLD